MAVKLKLAKRNKGSRVSNQTIKIAVSAFIVVCMLLFGVFAFYYIRYQKIVDRRMSGRIFSNAAKIYAGPEDVRVGEKINIHEIAARLRRAGYTDSTDSKIGSFRLLSGGIQIKPGPES